MKMLPVHVIEASVADFRNPEDFVVRFDTSAQGQQQLLWKLLANNLQAYTNS